MRRNFIVSAALGAVLAGGTGAGAQVIVEELGK